MKSVFDTKVCGHQQLLSPSNETDDMVRVILPFKDQTSTDIVRKQLKDLSLEVHTIIQPVFMSRKKHEGKKATNCKSACVLFIVFNVTCVMGVM